MNEQICELTERIAERVREMWERTVPASSTIVALISIEVDERWRTLISIGSGRSLLSLQPRWSDHHTTPKTDWLPPLSHIARIRRAADSRLYFICNDEASPKRIKRPFAQDAFQDLKDGRPAPIAGAQEQDSGMRPRPVPANIGKAQVHRDEEPSFSKNPLPDNRISFSRKTLIMDSVCLMTCL